MKRTCLTYVVIFLALVLAGLYASTYPLYGTLSVLEAGWLAVTLYGLRYAWRNYRDSVGDEQAAEESGRPIFRVVADMGVTVQRVICILQLAFVVLGGFAAFTPPPRVPQVITAGTITVLAGFIGGSMLLTFLSEYVHDKRREIIDAPDGNGNGDGNGQQG